MHTHTGDCPRPSATDEETFDRVFGGSDWAVMFILACGGQCYARLRFNIGPGAEVEIPVNVDYSRPFEACNPVAWEQEYLANVHPERPIRRPTATQKPVLDSPFDEEPTAAQFDTWFDFGDEDVEELTL